MNASLPVNMYFYAQTHMWDQSLQRLEDIGLETGTISSFLSFLLHLHW